MSLSSLSEFGSRFVPQRRLYLHRVNGVDEGEGRGRRVWVVSRALCRFFKVPFLPEVSAARQLDALKLQIERLSPFAETGSHYHFGASAIGLWVWDARAMQDAADAVEVEARRLTVLPETAIQPAGEGLRLVECLDGVEGQYWVGGDLMASRWWPSVPDERNWALFQRGASVTPNHLSPAPPEATQLPWLGQSWTRTPRVGWTDLGSLDLKLAAVAAAVLLTVGYGYFGAEWLRLHWAVSGIEAQIAAAANETRPITHARAAAIGDIAAIKQLHDLNPYPGQLTLMARVANILPKNETHFTGWTYDRGQLEITLGAGHPLDATFFVRALDKVPGFKNVSAERAGGDNTLRIRLNVEPL